MSTTFLPTRAQKLIIVSRFAYAANARDITSLFIFSMMTEFNSNRLGVAYSNIITSYDCIYPFWGNNFNSQKYNYVNTALFTLVSHNSPTSSSTGMAFNGTNQWVDTTWNPSVHATTDNIGFGVYERTNRGTNSAVTMGAQSLGGVSFSLIGVNPGSGFWTGGVNAGLAAQALLIASTQAWWSTQRISPTQEVRHRNGVAYPTLTSNFTSRESFPIAIGADGFNGTAINFSNLNTCFAAIQNINISAPFQVQMNSARATLVTNLGR